MEDKNNVIQIDQEIFLEELEHSDDNFVEIYIKEEGIYKQIDIEELTDNKER